MATDKSLNVKVNENSEAENKEMQLFLTDNFDKNREFRLEATVKRVAKICLKNTYSSHSIVSSKKSNFFISLNFKYFP